MEARKNPEYLKAVAAAVEEFRAALVEFLERLAALSLLARWVDECNLVEAPEQRDNA